MSTHNLRCCYGVFTEIIFQLSPVTHLKLLMYTVNSRTVGNYPQVPKIRFFHGQADIRCVCNCLVSKLP